MGLYGALTAMAPICTVSLESMRQGASSLGPATSMFVITSDTIALPRHGARSALASRTVSATA